MLVCHCKRVHDDTIHHALAAGAATPEDLGRATGAGTGCGGCVPELRRLCAEAAVARAAIRFDDVA